MRTYATAFNRRYIYIYLYTFDYHHRDHLISYIVGDRLLFLVVVVVGLLLFERKEILTVTLLYHHRINFLLSTLIIYCFGRLQSVLLMSTRTRAREICISNFESSGIAHSKNPERKQQQQQPHWQH